MTERDTPLYRRFVCWIFGECWRISEARQETDELRIRVDRLERRVRDERGKGEQWRPADAFRPR